MLSYRELRHKDRYACSGIITEQTKITFRSRSARLIWLVQMSAEMWEYSSPYERDKEESRCETYFDKWIAFLHRLFAQWKDLEVTHSLTIVFFSRTFLGTSPPLMHLKRGSSSATSGTNTGTRDVYGRAYEDHFRIVIENTTCTDWDSLIVHLKEAFVKYPREVQWNLSAGEDARRPSSASQGNLLEAINVTLNLLQYHYLDRDLHRTGNSIVIVSAGNGVFEVGKGLAAITYERMMVNGIGSDMLSLGLPPLHTAPFFLYVRDLQSVDTEGVDFAGTYYESPHWMHLSFVSYGTDKEVAGEPILSDSRQNQTVLHVTDIDGRPVMPNGFLLPGVFRVPTQANSGLTPTFFSSQRGGASPATRSNVLTQQRQMISDRDFTDILEACRPRNGTVLPSALDAAIRIFELKNQQEADQTDAQDQVDDIRALPEWGSMGFDTATDSPIKHRRTVALGEEPAVDLSPLLEPTPSGLRVDELDKGSAASSFTSQYSNCGLGVSYDRPFLASGASPTLTGIQVQKSPSMDIVLADDTDMDGSDESVSSTGLDLGGESSVESGSDARRRKRGETYMDTLRKLMREFDTNFVIPSSPNQSAMSDLNLGQNSERSLHVPPSPAVTPQLAAEQRTRASSGGIGAALTNYRMNSGGSATHNGAEAASSFGRGSSTTILSGLNQSTRRRAFPDVSSRGMSPLLLPPVGHLSSLELRRSSYDNRFIQPGEINRSVVEQQGQHPQYTQLSSTRSAFSRSPPRSGSPILTASVIATRQDMGHDDPWKQGFGRKPRTVSRSRRKKAFNPFRQQDEDEVLAKKSHNRRRWSHVFPLGEIEFKRKSGPNWKSLTFPAILPISIDYFPSQQEVDHNFTFGMYNVTLSEFENSPYSSFSSNKDALMEMVRQRLTQDYQLVPSSHVNASNFRRESLRDGLANRSQLDSSSVAGNGSELIRQFLSMGHRLQVLTYDSSTDVIEVTTYDAKVTRMRSEAVEFRYKYMCFCQESQQYSKAVQVFHKYGDPYKWNKVDRIVCGGEDRELQEDMRFKRLMFGIIPPDRMESAASEKEYTDRFDRLLEYLNKLSDSSESLKIKIVTGADKDKNSFSPVSSSPGISSRNSMVRFYVRLRKTKRDTMEWMEVVMDHTFDTSWSYRIMFNWLVATADRVEAQVQLLQRRCAQFGLNLVPFPEISVSKNIHLGPFKAPALFEIHDSRKVEVLDRILLNLSYVHDGVFYTDIHTVLECIDESELYDFGKRWSRPPAGRQFVHRSGTLFVRILTDLNRRAIVVVLGNYLYSNKSDKLGGIARKAFAKLRNSINKLCRLEDSGAGGTSIDFMKVLNSELKPDTPSMDSEGKRDHAGSTM